ncbi:hypothetical protein QK290_15775 [Pseudarthrobacter sp. AL07]|uniref:DUF6036 family nucleotidyltransferase n=1 Tax=unclassified Pseudarthrobacter TaxID=2647000 RepID=UPI00249B46D7|nr:MULTISPECIES: DUF6036 family nucleotidyltransferase [unclassified Pseudarthrobacter]MDI3195821.1 hypothetical protein [Pseudarthrobacter sp. AL20]MDI3209925.1 hypothetical protein [Pseudarthrobacter sp. AL07]
MRRDELEHAIRAATQIIQDDQVIIIGSQSILGSYSEDQLPAAATMSPEVDIAPMRDADADALSDQLSFDAGEWSEFHATYGFYIEGVGKRTAILPPAWEYRLVGVRNEATNNATGLCLEPHDLCAAKLMAHREKDFEFVRALVLARLIDPAILEERLASIDLIAVESDQDVEVLEYRQRQSIIWLAGVLPPDPGRKQ